MAPPVGTRGPKARALLLPSVLAALLLGATTLGGNKAKRAGPPESELARAPAIAETWRNPYQGRADAVLAGRKLYLRHCASCHGKDARGRGKAPDLHLAPIQSASPGRLFWFLKNGNLKEGMPSWSRLPDLQRWQIVSYLKSLE